MGLFSLFGRKAVARSISDIDWASMKVDDGLPAMADALRLHRGSWSFEQNITSKLQVLDALTSRMDSELELGPRLALSGELPAGDYDGLTPFGKSAVMLLWGVGNIASSVGGSMGTIVGNALDRDSAELRSLVLVCKAYEFWGDDALVGACVETFMPQFSPKIDALPPAEAYEGAIRQTYADALSLIVHVRDLFYDHYRPRRMPHMSMRDPQPKTFLDVRSISDRAMLRAP